MQAIHPIAYEILRRDDGMLAMSVNAGLIDFEPGAIRIRKGSVFVLEKMPPARLERRTVELAAVGDEVIGRVVSEKFLRLFEFASFGMTGAHRLELLP